MRRIPEFDAIRGLAALAIVLFHLWFLQTAALGSAVNLFFVLSGYLITSIILGHGDEPGFLGRFYARRSLRIWPIYYLGLGVVALAYSRGLLSGRLDGLAYYVTYTQKLQLYWFAAEPPFPTAFQHTWTLAIEEQFYLVWPALALLAGRRRLVPVALGIALVSVAARAIGFSRWILLTEADGLALGSVLAAILHGRAIEVRRGAWTIGFGAFLVTALIAQIGLGRIGVTARAFGPIAISGKALAMNAAYAGLVGLIAAQAGRPWLAALRWGPIVYLGKISYGLYLYHQILLHIARDAILRGGGRLGPWFEPAILVASVAVAALSWEFVEKPILGWKDRFGHGRKAEAGSKPIAAHHSHVRTPLRSEVGA